MSSATRRVSDRVGPGRTRLSVDIVLRSAGRSRDPRADHIQLYLVKQMQTKAGLVSQAAGF